MPTPPTLSIKLLNSTTSDILYAYVTGRPLDSDNAWFLLRQDGITPYYPTSPSSLGSPVTEDCAISLGGPGNSQTITVPHLAGARMWFSIGEKLTFMLNPGPELVQPSVSNSSDPNFNLNWGFAEFTYNRDQIFVNISYVDFVSLPISLTLQNSFGEVKHVTSMTDQGLDHVCAELRAQDARDGTTRWSSLIVQHNGRNLRALSPKTGIVTNPDAFRGYYEPYVAEVWAKYSNQPLSVNTQAQFGTLSGQVVNNVLTIGSQSFDQPSTADIFSCSTGPFEEHASDERKALIPRLCAALNRSTLLVADEIPDMPAAPYQNPITNHYARIVHESNLDGRGYAFPYDDVGPSGGQDVSGSVGDGFPRSFLVAVGGLNAGAPPKTEL